MTTGPVTGGGGGGTDLLSSVTGGGGAGGAAGGAGGAAGGAGGAGSSLAMANQLMTGELAQAKETLNSSVADTRAGTRDMLNKTTTASGAAQQTTEGDANGRVR